MATRTTEITGVARTTHMQNTASARQVAGIVLLASGWGWAMANFTPPDASLVNYLIHTIPVLVVLALGLGFLCSGTAPSRWATVGLNILAVISSAGLIVGIILGAINSDPNGYGVQTLADRVPAVILIVGGLLWLSALIPARRDVHTR
ncbi:MAG: hypothetical protein ACHQ4H_10760 [Ktedonobacterales bacterium]